MQVDLHVYYAQCHCVQRNEWEIVGQKKAVTTREAGQQAICIGERISIHSTAHSSRTQSTLKELPQLFQRESVNLSDIEWMWVTWRKQDTHVSFSQIMTTVDGEKKKINEASTSKVGKLREVRRQRNCRSRDKNNASSTAKGALSLPGSVVITQTPAVLSSCLGKVQAHTFWRKYVRRFISSIWIKGRDALR